MSTTGYDIIGDVHGHADALEALLRKLGYIQRGGDEYGWCHPEGRRAVFLGDFVDRGPAIRRTLSIVRAMVANGDAAAVMGNHEYNLLMFHTPDGDGDYLRPRSAKNVFQHSATIAQFQDFPEELESTLEWVRTLPLWLELDGFRVVHACWRHDFVDRTRHIRRFDDDVLRKTSVKGSVERTVVRTLLKGPEVRLPDGCMVPDRERGFRTKLRVRWWEQFSSGSTYTDVCVAKHDAIPSVPVPAKDLLMTTGYPENDPPLFIGHYSLPLDGAISLLASNVACLDFSVARGGDLAAYRWDGESILDVRKVVLARFDSLDLSVSPAGACS